MTKSCFKCGSVKPLSDFYRHPRMRDGHLNKCKECAKLDVRERYTVARDDRSAYERARSRTPARRAARVKYTRALRKRDPEKAAAWNAVSSAIRDGRLVRGPCEVCGAEKVQAHHEDYSKPLAVRWLCFACHREHGHGQVTTRTG